jgi:hypothetical protein
VRPYRSLTVPANVDELVQRIGRLQPASMRLWGTLTPHEMLCHLNDSFAAVLGEREVSAADTWFSRTLVKWIALHTSLPWPSGVPTRPEVDPKQLGTKPDEFERDRAAVVTTIRRFVLPATVCSRHPAFGTMSRNEWLLWGYAHVDHHLRQFGL